VEWTISCTFTASEGFERGFESNIVFLRGVQHRFKPFGLLGTEVMVSLGRCWSGVPCVTLLKSSLSWEINMMPTQMCREAGAG